MTEKSGERDCFEACEMYRNTQYHPAPLLRTALQVCDDLHLEMFRDHPLKLIQFLTLKVIYENGPLSKARLGEKIHMRPTNLNAFLKPLETMGLLQEEVDAEDGRKRIVSLTDKGRAEIEFAIPKTLEHAREVLSPLREAERPLFIDMLRRVAFRGETTLPDQTPYISAIKSAMED